MSDLFSVLMPVYNVELYIEESILSVLNQTYKNIELIIIDDSSTDGTYSICERFLEKHQNIKLIKTGRNSGIVGALNLGLNLCKGNFIARIDGDDIAECNRIEVQIKELIRKDIDLIGCQMTLIDETGEYIRRTYSPVGQDKIVNCFKYRTPIAHIWLCKKKVYDELGGYREIAPAEDYDFLRRAFSHGFKIDNSEDFLMRIRIRRGNTATSNGLKQRKAFLYARKVNDGFCNYSVNEFKNYVSVSYVMRNLHLYSNKLLSFGYKFKSPVLKLPFVFIAAILSPHQALYLYHSLLYRFFIKR